MDETTRSTKYKCLIQYHFSQEIENNKFSNRTKQFNPKCKKGQYL
jgi:hypothetical protein